MKLLNELLNLILDNQPLLEMAMDRKEALQKIKNVERKLNEHLIKIFYFDDVSKNPWANEIFGYIDTINDLYLKPKNTKISNKDYFKILYTDYYGHGSEVVRNRVSVFSREKYKKCKLSGLSLDQVRECMEEFYIWLCPQIADDSYWKLVGEKQDCLKDKINDIIKTKLGN